MSEKELLKKKVKHYREEMEQLEQYLVDCLDLFVRSGITVGKLKAQDTSLKKYILGTLQHLKDIPPDTRSGDYLGYNEIFLKGAQFAYEDSIRVLDGAAELSEQHKPKDKRIKAMAESYRKIGENLRSRHKILKTANQEEIEGFKKGGTLEQPRG